MATPFTAKIKLTSLEPTGGGEQKALFTANYTDAQGNRVNQEWARYTPGFSLSMWLTDEFVQRAALEPGQDYTVTFVLDGEGH